MMTKINRCSIFNLKYEILSNNKIGIKIKNIEIKESTNLYSSTLTGIIFSLSLRDLKKINKNIGVMTSMGTINFSITYSYYLKNNFAPEATI